MLSSKNFNEEIIDKKATAVIAFTASWCKPSLLQREVLEKIKNKYSGQIVLEDIDVDSDEELADRFSAKTLPTIVLFANGEALETLLGFQAEEYLDEYVKALLQEAAQGKQEPKEAKN